MRRVIRAVSLALLAVCLTASAAFAMEIKLGIVTTPGSAQYIVAEKFKELVEERSKGDITVSIFHSASLGNETEILQQIQMNAVNMGVITLGPFDAFVPEVKVVNFPFLFKSYDHVSKILDGPLGKEVLKDIEKAGFKGLAFSENGFRNLSNNVRPVHSVEDVDGLKIRVMESALHKELWRVLGANPTPMGWPIYSELEQGVIDGQENPVSVIKVFKLYEVQKYLSLTGHVYSAHIDVANLGWFNGLDPEVQKMLSDSMYEAAVNERNWNRENEAGFLAELEKEGMIIDKNPDKASFRAKAVELKNMELFTKDPSTAALLDKFLEATK
ncbi:TRAP transporter substrate-binding protein [Oceanidesulfovibrio marinus]|uniref:TRAP transporter substrate-binding protein n=1 Tax=Oceanidesulfovibrio marinus TaxID=370038 RepID=A0ABX6NJM5_9BACT|nr:TRAP transporter substrate-binding protein [Oceanidesulfovibrio marinus]QJT10845.1 TRAP transporter substrate-binding protein [Oceanidesulfovibrio marinus]